MTVASPTDKASGPDGARNSRAPAKTTSGFLMQPPLHFYAAHSTRFREKLTRRGDHPRPRAERRPPGARAGGEEARAIIAARTETTSFMAQRVAPLASVDFRSRLLIDRHSSVLSHLPARRQASLAEPSCVDATTWNIFRTLAQ